MSFVTLGKTTISAIFDSGHFRKEFLVSNEYLDSYWFDCRDEIWDSIASQIAVIVEVEMTKRMKDKMNPEAYKKEFAVHAKDGGGSNGNE